MKYIKVTTGHSRVNYKGLLKFTYFYTFYRHNLN